MHFMKYLNGSPWELMHGTGEIIEKTPRQIELSRAMDEAMCVKKKEKNIKYVK